MRERHQCHAIDLRPERRCCIVLLESLFETCDALKCYVPARFELARNEPLGRIDGLISARRQ